MVAYTPVQVAPGKEIEFSEALGSYGFTPKERAKWAVNGKQHERDIAYYSGLAFVRADVSDPYLWEFIANRRYFRRFIPGAPLNETRWAKERSRFDKSGYPLTKPEEAKHSYYAPGDKLRITKGSLAGQKAICLRHTHPEKIFLHTYLLGAMQRLYMHPAWCELDEEAVSRAAESQDKRPPRRNRNRKRRFSRSS